MGLFGPENQFVSTLNMFTDSKMISKLSGNIIATILDKIKKTIFHDFQDFFQFFLVLST